MASYPENTLPPARPARHLESWRLMFRDANSDFFQQSGFGELLVAEPTPVIQVKFPYNINARDATTTQTGTGAVTWAAQHAVLSTSAAINSSATLQSKDRLTYATGVGALCRFTTVFTQGVAGSQQYVGIGNLTEDGFFFGYNGTSFGILWRNGGVETWIPQTEFNLDKLDGSTNTSGIPSKFAIDPTKGNVYQIRYQWLGYGQITFAIESPVTGYFIPVHRIAYTNENTTTSLVNPSLPFTAHAVNTTNDTDVVLRVPSISAFVEGKATSQGPIHAIGNTKTGVTTQTNIITIRNKTTYQGVTNRTMVRPIVLSVGSESNANQTTAIQLWLNPTVGGTPSFTDVSVNTSTVDYDTAGTTVSGGYLIATIRLGAKDSKLLNLKDWDMLLSPGDRLVITGQAALATEFGIGITWRDLF